MRNNTKIYIFTGLQVLLRIFSIILLDFVQHYNIKLDIDISTFEDVKYNTTAIIFIIIAILAILTIIQLIKVRKANAASFTAIFLIINGYLLLTSLISSVLLRTFVTFY